MYPSDEVGWWSESQRFVSVDLFRVTCQVHEPSAESYPSPIIGSFTSAHVVARRKRIRAKSWARVGPVEGWPRDSRSLDRYRDRPRRNFTDSCLSAYNIKLTRLALFTRFSSLSSDARSCYRQLHARQRSRNELFSVGGRKNGVSGRERGLGKYRCTVSLVEGKYCRWHDTPPLAEAWRNEGRNASVITRRTEAKLRIVWSTIALTG